MPDILIRMEMPQHCFNCSTKIDPDNRRCNIDRHIFEETLSKLTCRRDEDCPLIELPPHGDLIEAEPIKRFITDGLNRKEFGYDQIQVLTEIEYAPVIIPADK